MRLRKIPTSPNVLELRENSGLSFSFKHRLLAKHRVKRVPMCHSSVSFTKALGHGKRCEKNSSLNATDEFYVVKPLGNCNVYLRTSWASQKIKIIFHVFQYGGGGWLGNFSIPKVYIRGRDVCHYKLTCCVLTARVWGSHLTGRVLRAYMKETKW